MEMETVSVSDCGVRGGQLVMMRSRLKLCVVQETSQIP